MVDNRNVCFKMPNLQKCKSWVERFEKDLGKRDKPNIVWDESSSEDETFTADCKKRKTCQISPIRSKFSVTDNSISDSTNCDLSPIVGWDSLYSCRVSPDITPKVFRRDISPVIEKRRIRLNRHKQMKALLKQSSPVLFDVGTQHIEIYTPNTRQYTQAISVIEPFPSQLSTEIIPRNIESCNALYFQPVKKRKQFNKNSLAYHVHKMIKNKTNSIKFWHHEKVNRISCTEVTDDFNLEVQIIDINIEYGNVLLECRILSDNSKHDLKILSKDVLINVGVKTILNICWERQVVYRFYLPYTIEKVFYKGKDSLYICNISKVMKKSS